MLAKLIRTDDESTVMWDKFQDVKALAAENERAQTETNGMLSWVPCSPFEVGEMTAQVAVLLRARGNRMSGGNSEQQRHPTG